VLINMVAAIALLVIVVLVAGFPLL